jgi:hypothetical protein
MTNYLMVNKFIMCFVLIAFTSGCTTMRPAPATDAQSLANQIEVGDKIKITRRDNSDVAFKVSAVSAEGISGDGVLVAYSDIQQVQVREFSTGKTVGLVAGVVGILAIIVGSTVESDLGIGANRD